MFFHAPESFGVLAEPSASFKQAPEDLPEPEPEGCDEEGKKFVEALKSRV